MVLLLRFFLTFAKLAVPKDLRNFDSFFCFGADSAFSFPPIKFMLFKALLQESGGEFSDVLVLVTDLEDPVELRLLEEESLFFFCRIWTGPSMVQFAFSSKELSGEEITGALVVLDSLVNVPCFTGGLGLSLLSELLLLPILLVRGLILEDGIFVGVP